MDDISYPIVDDDLFKLGVEQSREGIAIHDEDGRFTYINPAMATMYGYEADELLGHSWRILYFESQIRNIESNCFPALRDSDYWRGNLIGCKKDGTTFDVDIALTLLKNGENQPAGIICRSQDISESVKVQTELFDQRQQYQLVFDHSPILIAQVGADYRYRIVNKQYCEWTGVHPSKIVGMHVRDVLNNESFEKAKPNIDLALSGQKVNFETKVPHSSGQYKWVNTTYIPDTDAAGKVGGFCAFIIDIDQRKREEFMRQSLMHAIEKGIEGFALHDEAGDFLYVNSAQANMYGYSPDELIGKSWTLLYDRDEVRQIEGEYFPQLLKDGMWRGELKGLKKTGEYFDVEVSLTVSKDDAGEDAGLFCACRDITERKRTQQEVDFLAFHDALTELPNRFLFKERLEQTIVRARQRHSIIALLFIDLDHFKHVNDTLGHSVGDQLLQCVAEKIQLVFRNEDMVARLSGDEFTVLLSELNSLHDVDTVINKLMQAFRKPIVMDNRELFQSISVGVSMYPQDGEDAETLMKNADAAMYRVKDDGRQNYCFYTPELTHSAQENMLYRGQLQYALDNQEFELHYQPLISLTENKILGFEALIRWRHPELGLVPPDKFICHAEESHLIIPIGNWVIKEVCRQAMEWHENGLVFDKIAVNVSGIQLRPGFAKTVSEILRTTDILPRFLELEITETFLMQGLKQPVSQLQELRDLGISLAIDDFGVGYSSLSQLRQLPTQCLKIDRSFVGDIADDLDDRAIVEAIIGLGKTLNLAITAEGVETPEQHALLKKMGCQKAQGYFYAKPHPAAEIPDLYQSLSERLKY